MKLRVSSTRFNSQTDYLVSQFLAHPNFDKERLNDNIKRSPSVSLFKKKIIGFIRPLHRPTYGVKDVEGIKLLTKLRTEFSDLRSHRFHHSFNCDNPVCSCLHEEESVSHYLLRCPRFNRLRNDLLGSLYWK